jgi:hypothetical protein
MRRCPAEMVPGDEDIAATEEITGNRGEIRISLLSDVLQMLGLLGN